MSSSRPISATSSFFWQSSFSKFSNLCRRFLPITFSRPAKRSANALFSFSRSDILSSSFDIIGKIETPSSFSSVTRFESSSICFSYFLKIFSTVSPSSCSKDFDFKSYSHSPLFISRDFGSRSYGYPWSVSSFPEDSSSLKPECGTRVW